MKTRPLFLGMLVSMLLLAACVPAAISPTPSGPSYAIQIQPIFTKRCIKCHSGEDAPRGLELDTYQNVVLFGSTYRPVVVPGDPTESELIRRIKGDTTPRMPFDGPPYLSDAEISLIEAWVNAGALDN